jgi:hypothetical protein
MRQYMRRLMRPSNENSALDSRAGSAKAEAAASATAAMVASVAPGAHGQPKIEASS